MADFLARFATRRIGAYRTLFFMQLFGFLGLTLYLSLASGTPHIRDLALQMSAAAWMSTIVAALLNVAASLALYRAFATGALAVVAPVAASYPVLTIVLDSWSGERLT
ncbi:MAG: EamA family transporter, partial [Terriglobia bacterium]